MEVMQTPSTLTEQVMDTVRDKIVDGSMSPDTWYSVYQLSAELGVSRSPVRDALLRLAEAGLVKFTRNRGFRVVETRPEDVAEIFGLRLGIEPFAAYRAALSRTPEQLAEADDLVARMDALAAADEAGDAADPGALEDEFFTEDRKLHALIMDMGGSHRGGALVETLRTHTRILGSSTAGSSRTLADILDEHRPVLGAIRDGDAEAARATMREHLTTTGKLLLHQALGDDTTRATKIWSRYAAGL